MTEFDAEPIPDPQVLFASLKDKSLFSKVGLAKGHWQVPLVPEDREKTAFRETTRVGSVCPNAVRNVHGDQLACSNDEETGAGTLQCGHIF